MILRKLGRSPVALWIAFVLVHAWLGLLNLYWRTSALGDVTLVYRSWMDQALYAHQVVGIDTAWVYPIVALVPMAAATIFGPDHYGQTWLVMVVLLNAIAFGILTRWGRPRERIVTAWWWLAFLVLLGPISLGRIDSVTVPIAVVAVVLIAGRPRTAAILFTVAMWIKVWPVALIGAALIALKDRARILVTVLVSSGIIAGVALLLGSGSNVVSFITQQTGRGLQIEAPVSSIWLWQAIAGVPDTAIYWDEQILTFQVTGAGVDVASALMTPLLAIAVVVIAVLGIRAVRAGASAGQLFPALSLAFVVALIAVNKVGSPQFVAWLAVPIVLGLTTSAAGHGRSFEFPAIVALVVATLTQMFFPYFYGYVLVAHPLFVAVLTARNLLEFVLLGWAILAVVRSPRAQDAPRLEVARQS